MSEAAMPGVVVGEPLQRSIIAKPMAGRGIEAALQHDPLSTSFRDGGVLLGEQIVVIERQSAEDNAIPQGRIAL